MAVVQVELTDDENLWLGELAGEKRVSVDSLIHDAVIEKLIKIRGTRLNDAGQRAVAASGRFHAGVTDLGENHDRYLIEAYES